MSNEEASRLLWQKACTLDRVIRSRQWGNPELFNPPLGTAIRLPKPKPWFMSVPHQLWEEVYRKEAMSTRDNPRCGICGHYADEHEEEPPYPCMAVGDNPEPDAMVQCPCPSFSHLQILEELRP